MNRITSRPLFHIAQCLKVLLSLFKCRRIHINYLLLFKTEWICFWQATKNSALDHLWRFMTTSFAKMQNWTVEFLCKFVLFCFSSSKQASFLKLSVPKTLKTFKICWSNFMPWYEWTKRKNFHGGLGILKSIGCNLLHERWFPGRTAISKFSRAVGFYF